jgi:RNA polymerase-binding transcription factor DksA
LPNLLKSIVAMDASSCLALSALDVVAGQQAQAAMAQLLLDHERRGMHAEDLLSSGLRYKHWYIRSDARGRDLRSQIDRAQTHLQSSNVEHAMMILEGQLPHTTDEEDEDEEDEDEEDEDEDMAQSEEPSPNGRYDFCEVCDQQVLGVVWFSDSFQNPSDNRRLYSACPTCRARLGLQVFRIAI